MLRSFSLCLCQPFTSLAPVLQAAFFAMSSGAEQPPTPFEELHSSGSIFDSHKYQVCRRFPPPSKRHGCGTSSDPVQKALSAHADANADADPCTSIVREFLVSGDVEDLKLVRFRQRRRSMSPEISHSLLSSPPLPPSLAPVCRRSRKRPMSSAAVVWSRRP